MHRLVCGNAGHVLCCLLYTSLWETLGIALVAAAVCMACAALIGKAAKKNLDKKVLAVVGAAAFVGAILAVILIARTPMPL